jgi:hypothetical protein
MKQRNVRHRGRPRIHDNPAWFGMKISQPERQKIRRLAKLEGRPASHIIMELVESELKRKAAPRRLTAAEFRKLPSAERSKLLRVAAKKAALDYEPGGELYVAGNDDILID